MKEHKRQNLNKQAKKNLNLTNMQNVTTAHVCVHHCAQQSYTTQDKAVLIIFPLILQTNTGAQMLSIGGEGES